MDQPNVPSGELTELALFPLNVVLFPGMRLPLHIFEERYKTMIGQCIEGEKPFGVVLIREGKEVGEPAEPFRVGTTARIGHVAPLEEGRLNIVTHGVRRFELVDITRQRPYMVGMVRYLEDLPGNVAPNLLAEVKAEQEALLRHLAALAGGWVATVEVSEDPVQLSFAAVASLVSAIDIPAQLRQRLLEAPTAAERLKLLAPLLQRGNQILQDQVGKRNPFQGARLN
ncbi:MAG: peptidase S16 [SAR202 cluster bacterium]|nr:peptidase S16 [SAR202 cluster bacterium]